MRITECTFGIMTVATERASRAPYISGCSLFLNRPGLIVIYEDEETGENVIYLYPREQYPTILFNQVVSFSPSYFDTSAGELTREGDCLRIETKRGLYEFTAGDFGISLFEKTMLLYLVNLGPISES